MRKVHRKKDKMCLREQMWSLQRTIVESKIYPSIERDSSSESPLHCFYFFIFFPSAFLIPSFYFLSDLIIWYSMVFTPSPSDSKIHNLHTQLCVVFWNDGWSSFKENRFSLFQQLSIVNSSGVVLRVYLPSSFWNLFWLGFAQILRMRSHPLWVHTFSFLMCLEDTLSLSSFTTSGLNIIPLLPPPQWSPSLGRRGWDIDVPFRADHSL